MHASSIVSKISKMYEYVANTFLLTCHKCHIKTFTREGETRERHAKKVKRQKLYEYTFIISTGRNIRKQWANYCKTTQVSVAYARVTLFQMYILNMKKFTIINNRKSSNILMLIMITWLRAPKAIYKLIQISNLSPKYFIYKIYYGLLVLNYVQNGL